MTRRFVYGLAALAMLGLQGCGSSNEDELREWMAQLRATTRPHVTPLSEPKRFQPENYVADESADPFNLARLTQALRRDSTQVAANATLIAPEMARRKAVWVQPEPKYPRGYGAMFSEHIGQADQGCDLDFLQGKAKMPEPEIH